VDGIRRGLRWRAAASGAEATAARVGGVERAIERERD
jgi:hypothetical protein